MSEGGFTVGSVISPGVTSRVPSECEAAPPAQDTQPRPNGRELKGFAPGTSAAELSLAAGAGLGLARAGLARAGLGGSGLHRAGLDGSALGGSGLGGAELGGVAEVDLGLLEFAVVDLETTGWSP